MLKIIKFNDLTDSGLCVKMNDSSHKYNLYQLNKNPILQSQNFERTSVGKGTTSILDLENRSSWTHKFKFSIDLPTEALLFFKQNNILYEYNNVMCDYFSLLKYEVGDFFLKHIDTNLTNLTDELNSLNNVIHQYTCLIYCPYNKDNEMLEGGEVIFNDAEKLYEIKFNAGIETNKNNFVMIIFSIDMYHEVLPIISGSRWVFKKPLFIKKTITTTTPTPTPTISTKTTSSITTKKIEHTEEELCDGFDYSSIKSMRGADY